MSSINTYADMPEPRFGHAWRDASGKIHATVRFAGGAFPFLAFDGAAEARALAAACAEAAEAMDRLAAEAADA